MLFPFVYAELSMISRHQRVPLTFSSGQVHERSHQAHVGLVQFR